MMEEGFEASVTTVASMGTRRLNVGPSMGDQVVEKSKAIKPLMKLWITKRKR